MGVKFAHAFGAHVVLFTTSPGKIPWPDAWLQVQHDAVILHPGADRAGTFEASTSGE